MLSCDFRPRRSSASCVMRTDVELAQLSTVAAGCKLLVIIDAKYFRWRKQYGGMTVD